MIVMHIRHDLPVYIYYILSKMQLTVSIAVRKLPTIELNF